MTLTNEQKLEIRRAVEEAYTNVRWIVGDSKPMLLELHLLLELHRLALASYIRGLEQGQKSCTS